MSTHQRQDQQLPRDTNAVSSLPSFWESNGDYQVDSAAHEDHQKPLYAAQSQLPRLPVPSLQETVDRFVDTAWPLTNNNSNDDEERQALQDAVQTFPQQAQYLQERLLERQQQLSETTSWLQQWWNQLGYLQVRESNTLHVSYFFRESRLANNHSNNNDTQQQQQQQHWLDRGACVLQEAALYADNILDATRPTDRLGKRQIPLCSTQYKYLFQASRFPQPHQDGYLVYDQRQQPQQQPYAIVAYRQQFYQLPLYTTTTSTSTSSSTMSTANDRTVQTLRSPSDLRRSLERIVASTTTPRPHDHMPPPLGWLTATNRDAWAANYQFLLQHDEFAQALHTLQGGLFLLALDDDLDMEDHDHNNDNDQMKDLSSASNPVASRFAAQLLHGSCRHTANRWWDKSMQVVVAKVNLLSSGDNNNDDDSNNNDQATTNTRTTTRLGYVGEHSMSDGMPAAGVWQHLLERCNEEKWQKDDDDDNNNNEAEPEGPDQIADDTSTPVVEPLFQSAWDSMTADDQNHVVQAIDKAREEVSGRIQALDCRVLEYTKFGAKHIAQAGYSVDAFGQMAMQLASYRAFGNQTVATYESTQTRQFLHGRTETTRTVSPSSAAFVQAMMMKSSNGGSNNEASSLHELHALLKTACDTHVKYSRDAARGMGVDRHFMGLQMLQQPNEPTVDLFQNKTFLESKRWRLSTSTLPGTAPGFGPVQDDGVGVGYDLEPERLIFTITGWKTSHSYAPRMEQCLAQALDEMAPFLQHVSSAAPPNNSKL